MKKKMLIISMLCMAFSLVAFNRRNKRNAEKPFLFKELAQLAQADAPEMVEEQITETEISPTESIQLDAEEQLEELADQPQPPQEAVAPQADQTSDQEYEFATEQEAQSTPSVQKPKSEQQTTVRQALTGEPVRETPDLTFDILSKRKQVVTLVEYAAKALREKTLDEACGLFSHTKEFINGELYIYVFDMKGNCLAHGEDSNLIWQNLINLKDSVGTPIVKQILKSAKQGGGWVTYGWNNATKISYIMRVDKGSESYAVGSGFYPQSKEEAVVNLVKGAVALFNEVKDKGDPIDWAFGRMSYPSGGFTASNLYVYALDFEGNIVAQGERPGLIGTNSWNYRDEKGKYVNREIVKKLRTATSGVWVDYVSKRALKKAYAEKVTAPDGKEYFIACGYYPDANQDKVEELLRKGYQFMKTHGKTAAIEEFSSRRNDTFRYGDLYLVVYDMKGTVVTHGGNADQIGINMLEEKDQDGHPYIKDMIQHATKTGVWTNAKVKGSFESTYAAKIDLGLESFVIACSYYPVSKAETMTLLVQSAVSYLADNPRETAFAEFVKPDGNFRRGDLQIVALDTQGLCFAYGDDYSLIWRNILKLQDEDGRPFIKMFINSAQQGPNYVETKLNKAQKVNYVIPIEKEGKKYVISSGFYR